MTLISPLPRFQKALASFAQLRSMKERNNLKRGMVPSCWIQNPQKILRKEDKVGTYKLCNTRNTVGQISCV